MRQTWLISLIFILASPAALIASSADPISLVTEAVALNTPGYYIKGVSDKRANKAGIGAIYISGNSGQQILSAIDLIGGAERSLQKFLAGPQPKPDARAINVEIIELSLNEVPQPGRLSGELALVLQFTLAGANGDRPLVKYKTGARYTRSLTAGRIIEPAIRRLLVNGVKFLDSWLSENGPENPDLAAALKISISDHLEKDADTLYHQTDSPLQWSDFKGRPQTSRYAAAVFPSFGYDMHRKVLDHEIQVHLKMRVYMVRSASWYSPGRVDDRSLAHEQKHFDIARIVANRFTQKVLKSGLTPENYESFISMEYLESYREMNRLQKEYDEETAHGTDHIAQDRWNAWIEKELTDPTV